MSIHFDSISGPMAHPDPTVTQDRFDAFHDLLRITGERLDGDPTHMRSHEAVLDLAGVFMEWVDDTETNLGHPLGLETGPDHSIVVNHDQTVVPGTGKRPNMFQRIPKDRRGHGHDDHDIGHAHGHHIEQAIDKTRLPRYRPMEEFTGTKFQGGNPEERQRFWELSSLRIGQGQAVRDYRWYIGQPTSNPVDGVRIFDNNGGKTKIVRNIPDESTGRVVEHPKNSNILPLMKPIERNGVLLPDTATTLHVLGRAARFAVDNNLDPKKFI